jgi:hypothetical protein
VAHAAEYVGAELVIATDLNEREGAAEMLLGYHVTASIVGHPAGFFCFDAVSLFSFS